MGLFAVMNHSGGGATVVEKHGIVVAFFGVYLAAGGV